MRIDGYMHYLLTMEKKENRIKYKTLAHEETWEMEYKVGFNRRKKKHLFLFSYYLSLLLYIFVHREI